MDAVARGTARAAVLQPSYVWGIVVGDSVTQLLDLARDVLATPLAVLARTDGSTPRVRRTSSELSGPQVRRLLDGLPDALTAASPLSVEVPLPDGTVYGHIVGLGAPGGRVPARPDGLPCSDREALHLVAALIGGVVHHHDHWDRDGRRRARAVDAVVRRTARAVVLQPIVDLCSGRVVGVEALSRFTAPDGEALRPAEVFTGARQAGLGATLEQAAIAAALELLPVVPAGAYLSVNASPDVLLHPATAAMLLAATPERLVVEITEHVAVADYDVLAAALAGLRERGVQIAVDDAGAGFASLRHVVRLAPDVVKLDAALVHGVDGDPALRAATRAMVGFCAETGATLVAEGVERPGDLTALRRLGVACGQGNLLGPPVLPARPAATAAGCTADDGADRGARTTARHPWGHRAVGTQPVGT